MNFLGLHNKAPPKVCWREMSTEIRSGHHCNLTVLFVKANFLKLSLYFVCLCFFLIFHFSGRLFLSYFTKAAVCFALGVNRHRLMVWEFCPKEALHFISAETHESCRSCLRHAGTAGLCSYQAHVLCQALHTERLF